MHKVGSIQIGKIWFVSQSGTNTSFFVEHSADLHLIVMFGGSISLKTAGGSTLLQPQEAALLPTGFRRSSGRHSLVSLTLPPAAVEATMAAMTGEREPPRIQRSFEQPCLASGPMAELFHSFLLSLDAVLPLGDNVLGKLVTDDV